MVCRAWVVTRTRRDLGTLSEEQLHVLSYTAATFCFLINSGPCLNAESWGLEQPGVVGVSLSGQGVEQDEL